MGVEIIAVSVIAEYAVPFTYAVRHSAIVPGSAEQSVIDEAGYVSTYVKGVASRRSVSVVIS